MKYILPVLSAMLLATLAACEATDAGGPVPGVSSGDRSALAPSSNTALRNTHAQDAYREMQLGRYDMD